MKKTILFVSILLCLSFLAKAQQPNIQYPIFAKAKLGVAIQTFSENPSDMGYHIGIGADIPLRSNWLLYTGLSYAQLGNQSSFFDMAHSGSTTVGETSAHVYRVGAYQYQYLVMPLQVQYTLGTWYVGGGLDTYFFYQHQTFYDGRYEVARNGARADTYEMSDIRWVNWAANIALGYTFSLGETWSAYVEPQANYLILSNYKNSSNRERSRLMLSANVGLRKLLFYKKRG